MSKEIKKYRINMDNIEKRIRNILNKNINLQRSAEQIKIGDGLFAIGMDSLNIIELIVAIEEEFGFEFDNEDLIVNNFRTLKDTIYHVKRMVK
jgi:acyl carrier protein